MATYANKAASAYSKLGIETGAMSASPHQLIVMLFDGAHTALTKAQWSMTQGDVERKGRHLSKAVDIIELGLRAALDPERGGEIAERLDSLYDYMARTLVRANARNDAAMVAHVDELLVDIGSAWKQISPATPLPADAGVALSQA